MELPSQLQHHFGKRKIHTRSQSGSTEGECFAQLWRILFKNVCFSTEMQLIWPKNQFVCHIRLVRKIGIFWRGEGMDFEVIDLESVSMELKSEIMGWFFIYWTSLVLLGLARDAHFPTFVSRKGMPTLKKRWASPMAVRLHRRRVLHTIVKNFV